MYHINADSLCVRAEQKKHIHIALFLYWAALVVLQNIGAYTARTTIDIVLKMFLLLWIVGWYLYSFQNARMRPGRLFLFSLFAIFQFFSFCSEETLGVNLIVSYVFPLLFLFLTFVYGYNCTIDKKQYVTFLNCVIAVVAYAAIYAIVFKSDQFLSAFTITSAYGNELSSFFVSSHEYAMYLLGGIIACIVCLEVKHKDASPKKYIYFVCLILFVPNLILTFSRTTLLALAVFLLVYVLFRGTSKMRVAIVVCLLAFVLLFLIWDEFNVFVLKIVLKGNDAAGRDELYALARDYFDEGNIWQKLFGRGITNTEEYFRVQTRHSDVHNAYLQILLSYGLVGLGFMIGFLVNRLIAAIKLLKRDYFVGVLLIGLLSACVMLMLTNTSILFNSPIDSFFLTVFTIVIPKYLENGIYAYAK